jgi:hypothetical protein
MSSFQSSLDEQHKRETDPRRVFGPTIERLPLMLISLGVAVIAGTALAFAGPIGVAASLLIEGLFLLVSVPVSLLLVLGVARTTGLYFGTLGQAIVRLSSFFVASQGLLIPVVLSMGHFGDLSVAIVALFGCLVALFWLFVVIFRLDPLAALGTFRVLLAFACALAFQSLVIWGLLVLRRLFGLGFPSS